MTDSFNVINFHIVESCNYKCSYCFAIFKNESELKMNEWYKAVDIVANYFERNNIKDGRINIAGGEPLIVGNLNLLIDYIYNKGIKVSIITNGSRLTNELVDSFNNKVEMIGVSIDALTEETNLKIGRSQGKKVLDLNKLIDVLNYAKNKGIRIKVNTVVSKLNLHEDLSYLYEKVDFDRIKFLQVRINDNCNEKSIDAAITKEEFNSFILKHQQNKNFIIEPEDEIKTSYIIIDPNGYLMTNHDNLFKKVGSIFNQDLETLIQEAKIRPEVFKKRYQNNI